LESILFSSLGEKFLQKLGRRKNQFILFEQWLIVPQVSRNQRICIGGNEYFRKHNIVQVCVSFRGKRLRLNVTTRDLKMIDHSAFPFCAHLFNQRIDIIQRHVIQPSLACLAADGPHGHLRA